MYVTSSKDDGATFSKAIKPGKGTWQLDACPMDGGMLAAGKKGGVLTLWQRNGEIYMAEASGAAEKLLGAGQQPWMTGTAKGPIMAMALQQASASPSGQ